MTGAGSTADGRPLTGPAGYPLSPTDDTAAGPGDRQRLAGQVFLVTGGGSGVGAAVAAACAREGASVTIAGRDPGKLEAVCRAAGTAVDSFPADVTDRAQVGALVDHVITARGRIDVLVSNAGVNVPDRSLDRLSPPDWDRVLGVNATGAFNVAHAVLPHMRRQRRGLVIAISSMAGLRVGVLGGAAYCASKHAMAALTRSIDLEEAANGIRATVISPGEIDTPILEFRPEEVTDQHRARILRPEDVAEAVVYVASQPDRVAIPELVIKPSGQRS
ncbi:MAG: SDR family NAD(P)-dependent oxidoreductase [Gemmatimonadota bacterium]